jgi:general secretion pathway protein J
MSVARTKIRQGFTILEVTVAITILGGILVAAWLTFDGIARMQETVATTEELSYTARITFQRVGRELRMAFLTRNPSPTSAYLTLFRATDENPIDTVSFNTFSHIRMYHESKECDTTEISYFGEQDPDDPQYSLLLHREASRIDGLPEEGGTVEVLARRVVLFNLRYFDDFQQEWSDVWDSTSAENLLRLPRAVEVVLILADLDGMEHFYSTTFLLPMYKTRGNQGPLPPSPQE